MFCNAAKIARLSQLSPTPLADTHQATPQGHIFPTRAEDCSDKTSEARGRAIPPVQAVNARRTTASRDIPHRDLRCRSQHYHQCPGRLTWRELSTVARPGSPKFRARLSALGRASKNENLRNSPTRREDPSAIRVGMGPTCARETVASRHFPVVCRRVLCPARASRYV